jgi:hypothetical protein
MHSDLPLSHRRHGRWRGQREWQATRSKEGHDEGGKGNGDGNEGGWWLVVGDEEGKSTAPMPMPLLAKNSTATDDSA